MSGDPKHKAPLTRLETDELRARKRRRQGFKELARTPIVIVLDGVEGSYNHGAIFRLCDALLIERLHLCHAELAQGHRRFIKAARGTYKWVPHSVGEETIEVLKRYRALGYQLIGVELCEGSISLAEARFRAPLCLVLGAELKGLSEQTLALLDHCVELPSLGMANSMNVAMSAGMVALSAYQQLMASAEGGGAP